MFRYTYDSGFPMWSDRDVVWHKKLRNISCNQVAISTIYWSELNRKQKKLLIRKYGGDLILLTRYISKAFTLGGGVDKVPCIILTKDIEDDFFCESQFGAMWDILYTDISPLHDSLTVINSYIKNKESIIHFDAVISIMQKVYNDYGSSMTEILSKVEIQNDNL